MSLNEKEKCEYCSIIVLKKNLAKHQTSKKCMKAYEKLCPISAENRKLKINLEISEECCEKLKKEYEKLENENEILKVQNKELEKTIERLNGDKDKIFDHIVDIAKKPTSVNNNTIKPTTNTVNNTVIMTPLDMSSTTFSEKIANGFRLNDFLQGQAGVAKFAVNNLLRDDNGKLMYVCTNPSRHLFQFKSPHGVIEKDPKAVKLTEAISEEIRKKSSQISSADDNLDSIGLDELMEQYNDIKEIGDPNKNTGFRNVLTGLTS
jgi:hypothetical protein